MVASTGSKGGSQSAAAAGPAKPEAASSVLPRRQLLSLSLLAPAAAVLLGSGAAAPLPAAADEAPAAAASSGSTVYTDPEDKFSIEVPSGWALATGAFGEEGTLTTNQARFSNAAGLRRVVAFLPEDKPEVSVAVTIQ